MSSKKNVDFAEFLQSLAKDNQGCEAISNQAMQELQQEIVREQAEALKKRLKAYHNEIQNTVRELRLVRRKEGVLQERIRKLSSEASLIASGVDVESPMVGHY